MSTEPETPPSIFPLTLGAITLTAWDGFSYVDEAGRTYWSGAAEPSEADAADALSTPRTPPAPVEALWSEKLAGVIVDPVTSIPLKASIATRDILTATLLFLREAELAGALAETTEQTIWDAANTPHLLTVADLRGLLLRYGAAWQQMHAQFAP